MNNPKWTWFAALLVMIYMLFFMKYKEAEKLTTIA